MFKRRRIPAIQLERNQPPRKPSRFWQDLAIILAVLFPRDNSFRAFGGRS